MALSMSSDIFSGSFFPMKGMTAQPVVPSYACEPVMPWTVKSMRTDSGRALVRVMGTSIGPIFILPVAFTVCTALILSMPPMALMCFSTISSAVCANADTARNSAQTDSDSFFMEFSFSSPMWGCDCAIRAGDRAVSVVIARLQELDPIVRDEINDPMFLGETARPSSSGQVFERLGLADPGERIAHDRFDEIEGTERDFAVGLYPVAEILAELGMEDGLTIPGVRHVISVLIETEIFAQPCHRLRAQLLRSGPCECPEKTLRVFRRAKEMGRLQQTAQFVDRDQSDIFSTTAVNDHRLT